MARDVGEGLLLHSRKDCHLAIHATANRTILDIVLAASSYGDDSQAQSLKLHSPVAPT